MATSTCTSTRHSEHDCLIKYSTSGLKFKREKWCDECKQRYPDRRHPAFHERGDNG